MAVTAGLIEANAARWMAPELLDSHTESPRLTKETDIYAFSMLVIEVRRLFPLSYRNVYADIFGSFILVHLHSAK